ncbi:HAUS augmin-like complex subunit 3 isoform X1 [Phyllopteryx taeniolatus]|uniref:HAUS augmin-like complex subunit 3 isoform X1 n=1 Tax=Phyllopteryx taeniolatus TaxID=161469 RepID=UPI002AD3F345|nr:HAUS augmin-like complex subunit 3 isoform X1 [Phyllopteryx taeniolatus]XP_061619394.1 HAUS augmin-like complex subunit 3 isoform X1 [Phyllopteryx taeniolatus]XP_061619395.1 HAUS augmin-like complex subunit 3 isoform X1 [Phyllopteryx taeniolatus]
MLNGGQFVEAMARLGYPNASSLEASEFDWLFNSDPENLHFLRFVCRSLNRSHVLTTEEVQAFQELQKSDRPILDEAALGKVLKTVGPSEEDSAAEDGVTIEDLEAELQALCREKELKRQRCKRLQAAAASRADVDLRLTAELESAAYQLSEANAFLRAENANTNAVLQSLADAVGELASHLSVPAEGTHTSASKMLASLLSQLPLNPYLRQEELNTKTLSAFTRKHFFTDLVENSCSEHFQVLDLSSFDGKEEEEDKEKLDVEQRRTQLARLQRAHIVAQHQLMQAVREEKSVTAGLDWLSEKSSSVKSIAISASLHVREVASKKELKDVEAEIEALLHGPVPLALQESARLLNVPVVKGDLALQLARQDYLTAKQNEVRDSLLYQKASFDVLHLAQQIELRKWRVCLNHLTNVNSRLVKESEVTSLRFEALAHPELALNMRPNPIISTNDATFSRLLQILDHDSSHGRAEPFQTYEALDQAASGLANNLQASRKALAAASREQYYTVAQLQGHCEALQGAMSTEFQQLVLGPQVCPTAIDDQELLCPNAQELTENLAGAESLLQRLQKAMQEIIGRVNTKHSQLERNSLLRRERDLYIYFHLDISLLQKVVEDLERRMNLTRAQP